MGYELYVKTLTGVTYTVPYDACDIIGAVKQSLEEVSGIPAAQQRLLYAGKQLEDGRTLSDYCVQRESVFHLILKPRQILDPPCLLGKVAYTPLHPCVYDFTPNFCSEELAGKLVSLEAVPCEHGVYRFPLLKPSVCALLAEEIAHFVKVHCDSGVALSLKHIGLHHMVEALIRHAEPYILTLLPSLRGTRYEVLTKAMMYSTTGNANWPKHIDGDLATLNISLCDGFSGGEFRVYPGGAETPVAMPHSTSGTALLHLGDVVHDVAPVTEGQRTTLIVKIKTPCSKCGATVGS